MHVGNHKARAYWGKLIPRAAQGEEIILTRRGTPVARLVALEPARSLRQPGAWRGRVSMADDFDVLPEELQPLF